MDAGLGDRATNVDVARCTRGRVADCKTVIRRFDSGRRLCPAMTWLDLVSPLMSEWGESGENAGLLGGNRPPILMHQVCDLHSGSLLLNPSRYRFGSASPSDTAAGRGPDESHASALYRLPHGSLHSGQGPGERRFKESSLMLDHYTRKATQDHLDPA